MRGTAAQPGSSLSAATPRALAWCALAAGCIALAILLWGGWVTRIALLLVAACALQGWWRGATQALAAVGGLLLGALLGPPLGRALEDLAAATTGLGGLAARGVSVLACGAIVAIAGGVIVHAALTRALAGREAFRRWDRPSGAAVGAAEGVLLSLVLAWGALVLGPVAQARSRADSRGGLPALVADASRLVRDSWLGRAATALMPGGQSRLLALLADFVAVANDQAALAEFVNSAAMGRVRDLPSVTHAITVLADDPQIGPLLERGSIDAPGVIAVLNSPTLLTLLDTTTLAGDVAPLMGDIELALVRARALVGTARAADADTDGTGGDRGEGLP